VELNFHTLLFADFCDVFHCTADSLNRQGSIFVHFDSELLLEHSDQFDGGH